MWNPSSSSTTTDDVYSVRPHQFSADWTDDRILSSALNTLIATDKTPPSLATVSTFAESQQPPAKIAPKTPASVSRPETNGKTPSLKRPASSMDFPAPGTSAQNDTSLATSQGASASIAPNGVNGALHTSHSSQSGPADPKLTSAPKVSTAQPNATSTPVAKKPRKSAVTQPAVNTGSPLAVGSVPPVWVTDLLSRITDLREQMTGLQTQLNRVERTVSLLLCYIEDCSQW